MNSRKAIFTLVIQILITIIGIISNKVILSSINPYLYGIYNYSFAIIGLFSIFSDFYFASVYFQRISSGGDTQKHFSTYVSIKAILLVIIAIALSLYLISGFFIFKSIDMIVAIIMCIVFLSYASEILFSSLITIFQAKREVILSQSISLMIVLINMSYLIVFVRPSGNVYAFAASFLVKNIFGILLLSYALRSKISIFKYYIDKRIFHDYVRFIVPLIPVTIVSSLYSILDPILIKMFMSYKEVGMFSASQKINALVLMLSGSLMTLLYSSFSQAAFHKKYDEIQSLSNRATKYISIPVVMISMYVVFNCAQFVEIFMDHKYLECMPIIQVFMFQVILMSISRTFDSIVMATEKLKYVGVSGVALCLLAIALNFVLIPKTLFGIRMFGLGPIGPALKSLIYYILSILVGSYYLKTRLNITIYWRFLIHIILAIISGYISFTIIPFPHYIAGHVNLLTLFTISFIKYSIIYIILLIAIREINRNDYMYLIKVMGLKTKNTGGAE